MLNMQKLMFISAGETLMVFFILLAIKALRKQHHIGMGEKTGRGIDDRLKESRVALGKAAVHIQSVFDHITNHKT